MRLTFVTNSSKSSLDPGSDPRSILNVPRTSIGNPNAAKIEFPYNVLGIKKMKFAELLPIQNSGFQTLVFIRFSFPFRNGLIRVCYEMALKNDPMLIFDKLQIFLNPVVLMKVSQRVSSVQVS